MDWLNLHASTLDSPEFVGAKPAQRSTWLCLLRFCIGQENSGRIVGANTWGDRRWQQLVRVTHREIKDSCELWRIDGDDIEVNFYPVAKQREIESKRQAGRDTVAKRWDKKPSSADSSATRSATCSGNSSADTEGELERNRKGNRNEKGRGAGGTPAPPAELALEAAPSPPATPARDPRAPQLADTEWLASLRTSPAYVGIDIDREHAKAAEWCRLKRKQLTRQRLLNWLNRCDRPMQSATGPREYPGMRPDDPILQRRQAF